MGIREKIAGKLRDAAEIFAQSPSGLYVPKLSTDEELHRSLRGRGHYDLYPKWIRLSIEYALEAAGPVGPVELEESCAYVLWRGIGENGARLTPPVALLGFRDMMEKLSNMGYFNDHTTMGENGAELQVNGPRVRAQIDAAECTRRAGTVLVLAWNAELGHKNLGHFHCAMLQKAGAK
jgi:hypothetical protein